MKKKIKQYFYDMHDLHYGKKCPNDFPFWRFILLDFPLEILTFIMLCLLFYRAR